MMRLQVPVGAARQPHPSDSRVQQSAEGVVLHLLNSALSTALCADRLSFADDVCISVDGIDRENRALCEIYCRLGALKPAQRHKIASDMLKLSFAERKLGGTWRKIICLADEEALQGIGERSWLKAAAGQFGTELLIVTLPPDIRKEIRAVQVRQNMKNAMD
jgi:hypothetical protein